MASIFLAAFLSVYMIFSISCKADLIANVCSKTVNPRTCNDALRSDPKYSGLDIRGLGQVAVDKSIGATNSVLEIVKTLNGGAPKPIVEACVASYMSAIDNINKCSGLLKSHEWQGVEDLQTKASAALTDVGDCDDEFGAREPANLKLASREAEELISIILAVANIM